MMDPAGPAKTLTAHLGKDTYSHIHYDPEQGVLYLAKVGKKRK